MIRDCCKASDTQKAEWLKKFNERKDAKRKQPEDNKSRRGGAVSFDVVNIATENELPSISVPSGVPTHLHNNMQNSMIDRDVSIIDSDKSHRPKSHTRVAHAERLVGDVDTYAKGSSNHSGHVNDENVTCQDSCAKGSSNHSDYWKRVVSFGTASAYLIVPVDDNITESTKPCSNRKRRTRQSRTYKCKANHKYRDT
jgi:hypothetical protein